MVVDGDNVFELNGSADFSALMHIMSSSLRVETHESTGNVEKWRGGSRASSIADGIMSLLTSGFAFEAYTECFLITARRRYNSDPHTRFMLVQLVDDASMLHTLPEYLVSGYVPIVYYHQIREELFSSMFRRLAGSQVSMTNVDYLLKCNSGVIALEEKHGNVRMDWSQCVSYTKELPVAVPMLTKSVMCNVLKSNGAKGVVTNMREGSSSIQYSCAGEFAYALETS